MSELGCEWTAGPVPVAMLLAAVNKYALQEWLYAIEKFGTPRTPRETGDTREAK